MQDVFAPIVYLLCFATSAACAWLLLAGYGRTSARLLLWSGLCFLLLAANNLLVVLDLLILPDFDFRVGRLVLALAAVAILLFGFIWDLEEEG
jgi:4-amino-4-deoxy-L-arabinose transferase-like glycosyltransferase